MHLLSHCVASRKIREERLSIFVWRESFKTEQARLFRVSVKPENLKQSEPVVMAIVYKNQHVYTYSRIHAFFRVLN